jgi:hypothetical protein
MTIRSLIIAAVLSAFAATASAQAQNTTSLNALFAVGSRVRVTSTALQGRTMGLVAALDEGVATLATDSGLVKIPVTSITAFDVSLGRKRQWLMGAAIGSGVGLLCRTDYTGRSKRSPL